MLNKSIIRICEENENNKWYEFKNKRSERVVVEIKSIEWNPKDKRCPPNLWKKNGLIQTPIYNYLYVSTYVYTADGCYGIYNPTSKLSEDGHRSVINFDWLLEPTKENEEKILNEIYRLANL